MILRRKIFHSSSLFFGVKITISIISGWKQEVIVVFFMSLLVKMKIGLLYDSCYIFLREACR